MSFNATVNVIQVLRVYPLKNRYTRCLVLLQSQVGTTTTTERAFIITPPHLTLSEGVAEINALVNVQLKKPTAKYPNPELSMFLVNLYEKKMA